MNFKSLLAILLVAVFVVGVENRPHGVEGRVHDGESVIVETNVRKRAEDFKKSSYLFNNIAKALTDIIQDVFTETRLMSFVKANTTPAQKGFIITDKINGKDVTDLFPNMVKDYLEYTNDGLLRTGNDVVSTYDKGETGNDVNALQWNDTVRELRKMVFELIDKTIEATWLDKQYLEQEKNLLNGMFHNIRNRIAEMTNENEYSNQHAMTTFMNNENNTNDWPKMKAVEKHFEEVLKSLPAHIRSWSIEAAKFFKMKLNKKG